MKVGDLVRLKPIYARFLNRAEYGIVMTVRRDGDVIVIMTDGRHFIDRAESFQVISSCNH